MHFPKTHTWVALFCSIKKTMVNGHTYATVIHMLWISSYKHCFVMVTKMAPALSAKLCSELVNKLLFWNFKIPLFPLQTLNPCLICSESVLHLNNDKQTTFFIWSMDLPTPEDPKIWFRLRFVSLRRGITVPVRKGHQDARPGQFKFKKDTWPY